jgi:hypothetical protein
MAHGEAREGKWSGNWRMEWVASTLHTTSEHGVSSITTAEAHTSAASRRLNWRPCRFKWTRPYRRKKKSGFCVCAITFQTQSTKTWRYPEDGYWLPVCHQEVTERWTYKLRVVPRREGTLTHIPSSPTRWDVFKDHPLEVERYGHITWHFCQCVSGYRHQQAGPWRQLLTETGHVSMKTATGWLCRGTGTIQGTECLLTSHMMAVTDYWELKTAVN